jgi:hypothetical protein
MDDKCNKRAPEDGPGAQRATVREARRVKSRDSHEVRDRKRPLANTNHANVAKMDSIFVILIPAFSEYIFYFTVPTLHKSSATVLQGRYNFPSFLNERKV